MQIRSILLPTDFSECGNYALSYAASLARTFKASIICINVIEPIVPTVGYSGMTEPLPIADGPSWGVPVGDGLGIRVDEAKVRKYHEHYRAHGQFLPYQPGDIGK